MAKVKDWLVYFGVRVFVCVIQSVRIETCSQVARVLAWLAADVLRLRNEVVQDNLRQAFPELSATDRGCMIRGMWHHLFLMVCEIAHVPRRVHRSNWRQHVRFRGESEMVRLLLEPRPVVMLSGHFGNFEVAGYMCGLFGFPTYTVARPLDNAYLHDFVNRFRQAKGQYILPKQGCAADVEAVLQAGQTLTLLGDQNAGPKGCWVEFFSRPSSCHKAVALFSLAHTCPLVVAYARRGDRPLHFEIGLSGVADPQRDAHLASMEPMTQWYSRRLEEVIREAPEQYWWVHRRWKGVVPDRIQRKFAKRAA